MYMLQKWEILIDSKISSAGGTASKVRFIFWMVKNGYPLFQRLWT